jgi:hypothetical protein
MRNAQQKITCYSETQVEVSYGKESVKKWGWEYVLDSATWENVKLVAFMNTIMDRTVKEVIGFLMHLVEYKPLTTDTAFSN